MDVTEKEKVEESIIKEPKKSKASSKKIPPAANLTELRKSWKSQNQNPLFSNLLHTSSSSHSDIRSKNLQQNISKKFQNVHKDKELGESLVGQHSPSPIQKTEEKLNTSASRLRRRKLNYPEDSTGPSPEPVNWIKASQSQPQMQISQQTSNESIQGNDSKKYKKMMLKRRVSQDSIQSRDQSIRPCSSTKSKSKTGLTNKNTTTYTVNPSQGHGPSLGEVVVIKKDVQPQPNHRSRNEVIHLQAIKELNQRCDKYRRKIALIKENRSKRDSEAQNEIVKLSENNKHLSNQILELKNNLNVVKKLGEQTTAELRALNEENLIKRDNESQEVIQKLQKDNCLLSNEVSELKSKLKCMKNQEQTISELKLINKESQNKRDAEYQNEIKKLRIDNCQLLNENEELRNKLTSTTNKDQTLAKLKLVKCENKDLKEDLEILGTVIRRLNKEMMYYQEKLRDKFGSKNDENFDYSSTTEANDQNDEKATKGEFVNAILNGECYKNIKPLLQAYDELIDEKNGIIHDFEKTLQNFRNQSQDIVRENEELYKTMSDKKDKDSVSFQEWKHLYDNAILVLEENDLLKEKCDVIERKKEFIVQSLEEKVTKLQQKCSLLEEENSKMKTVINQLELHCDSLNEKNSKLEQSLESRIPKEEHEKTILECKGLFEELKVKYIQESDQIKDKLKEAQKEKETIKLELEKLQKENIHVNHQLKSLESTLIDSKHKEKEMTVKISEAVKAKKAQEDSTTSTIKEMMILAQNLIRERENLEKSLNEQRNVNVQLMTLRVKETQLIEDLKVKVKQIEIGNKRESQKMRDRNLELEKVLETMEHRNKKEKSQLQDFLIEKSKHIDILTAEKKQLVLDLETVWKAKLSVKNSIKS